MTAASLCAGTMIDPVTLPAGTGDLLGEHVSRTLATTDRFQRGPIGGEQIAIRLTTRRCAAGWVSEQFSVRRDPVRAQTHDGVVGCELGEHAVGP